MRVVACDRADRCEYTMNSSPTSSRESSQAFVPSKVLASWKGAQAKYFLFFDDKGDTGRLRMKLVRCSYSERGSGSAKASDCHAYHRSPAYVVCGQVDSETIA